jgi:hypothetical protein
MSANDADRRRLRLLWIGGGTYFLILINGLRFFAEVPFQIVILGTVLNAMILTAFIVTISKVIPIQFRRYGDGLRLALAEQSQRPYRFLAAHKTQLACFLREHRDA